jgi:glyoxylase-like metal-dependent hydrolase (beta-lactamase superfamily II)
MNRLEKVLKEESVDLEHIIVTHWHHDHIGGVHNVVNRMDSGECVVKLFTISLKYNTNLTLGVWHSWLITEIQLLA